MENWDKIDAVQRMQNYIEEHLTEPIMLYRLAQAAGYSPWHASRIFKELTERKRGDGSFASKKEARGRFFCFQYYLSLKIRDKRDVSFLSTFWLLCLALFPLLAQFDVSIARLLLFAELHY
ncbi:hypothetical protein [Pelosinus sp. IPA-1]|uniref:hypothetical protein n=1 Tax=Pelosinus sp. IPA-1 TaxID=3029569 RepID=UPI002553CC83|nr:hypothetical protein [Pelosinus sp. IPA-1]